MPALAAHRPFHPAGRGPDRRPGARPLRLQRRLGHQLAKGLTPAQAARAESVEEVEVQAFLAQPAFARLVAAYRRLQSLPEAEARQRLILQARFLLEEAIVEGDVRAAAFVLVQEHRDRDPAAVLADGVLTQHRRAAAPATKPQARPAEPRPAPSPPRPATHPAARLEQRITARLRDARLREHAAEHAAQAAAGAEPQPAAASQPAAPEPSAAAPPRNRRQRRRQAAVARQAAPPPPPTPRGPATAARSPAHAGREPAA